MPNRPLRPCLKAGCHNLTANGYCDEHQQESYGNRYRLKGSTAQRGYNARWAKYSKAYRRRHPLCEQCLKEGRLTPSEHVDHITPVHGPSDPLFWDENNHQALCKSCHSRKTAREDGGFGHKIKG